MNRIKKKTLRKKKYNGEEDIIEMTIMTRQFIKILKYKRYDANQSNFRREKCDKRESC